MQDYNKRNLLFLLGVFGLLAVVFFSVVMLNFLEKGGWWSVYVPTAYIIYCIVRDFRRLLKYKDEK